MSRATAPRDRDHEDRSRIPRHGPSRRRWMVLAALLILPILVAELTVQTLIATNRLAPAAGHNQKLETKWRTLRAFGPIDILLLGPSTMNSGVEPAVLGELVEDELGRPIRVFNLGIPGLGSEPSLVRQLEREGRLPTVAVIGISTGGLGDRGEQAVGAYQHSPLGQLFTECDGAADRGYEAAVECQAGSLSALWRWRGRLDDVVRAIRGLGAQVGDRRNRRIDGFTEGPPRTVEQLERQVPVGLQNEARQIRLGDDAVARFSAIERTLASHGIPLVGVLIPYSPPYLEAVDARYPGWTDQWREAARQLSERAGFPIIDPGDLGDWWGDGSSQNIKHLSREGAVDFTHQLWEIPEFREALLDALGTVDPT